MCKKPQEKKNLVLSTLTYSLTHNYERYMKMSKTFNQLGSNWGSENGHKQKKKKKNSKRLLLVFKFLVH